MEMMASLSLAQLPSLVAFLASLAPACGGGDEAQARPLSAATPAHDFGVVFEGQLLEHVWEVRVGAPLTVREAKTDCGCTVARVEREQGGETVPYEFGSPLEAGSRLRVHARYDTRGRPGPARRAVTLVAGEGVLLPLTFLVDVHTWLRMEPADLPFTRVLEGVEARLPFRVESVGGEPYLLKATGLGLPPWVHLDPAAVSPDPAGRSARWEVVARLDAGAPRGTFSYPLDLETDVAVPGTEAAGTPRTFALRPAWTLQVLGPVALSSPNLEFGLVGARETVSRTVRLESFDSGFEPSAATATLEPLHPGEALALERTARIRARPSGKVCDFELVLEGLDPEVPDSFFAKLVIATGHPDLPRLEALVRGVRKPEPGARRP